MKYFNDVETESEEDEATKYRKRQIQLYTNERRLFQGLVRSVHQSHHPLGLVQTLSLNRSGEPLFIEICHNFSVPGTCFTEPVRNLRSCLLYKPKQ